MNNRVINKVKQYITAENFFFSAVFTMAASFGYVILHFVSKYW